MTNLLQLNSSIFSDGGQSTRLANEFVAQYCGHHPDTRVRLRDFATEAIPHLSEASFQAFQVPAHARTAEQQAAVAVSDQLIAELKAADIAVLGLPMYNFGLPSQLKAWFDHITRAGQTFRYTEEGPVGLLSSKRIFVLAARGGHYQGTAKDTQTRYIQDIFGFLGLDDISFIYAEGLALGAEPRDSAIAAAQAKIQRVAA